MSTSKKSPSPEATDERQRQSPPVEQEPGTNAVEHEPDPSADRKPDGEHPYIKRSPFTTGNY